MIEILCLKLMQISVLGVQLMRRNFTSNSFAVKLFYEDIMCQRSYRIIFVPSSLLTRFMTHYRLKFQILYCTRKPSLLSIYKIFIV